MSDEVIYKLHCDLFMRSNAEKVGVAVFEDVFYLNANSKQNHGHEKGVELSLTLVL